MKENLETGEVVGRSTAEFDGMKWVTFLLKLRNSFVVVSEDLLTPRQMEKARMFS